MKPKNGGFTLTELLAVIAIMGIIVGIATSTVLNISRKAKKDISVEMRNNLTDTAITYVIEHYTLTKCSEDFSKAVYENKNISGYSADMTCARKITVQVLKDDGIFKDNNNYCNNTDSVLVYRYFDGENSEYKAYIDENACTNY